VQDSVDALRTSADDAAALLEPGSELAVCDSLAMRADNAGRLLEHISARRAVRRVR